MPVVEIHEEGVVDAVPLPLLLLPQLHFLLTFAPEKNWLISFLFCKTVFSSPALYAAVDDGDADDDDDEDEAGDDENDDDLDAEHEGVKGGKGSAVQLGDKEETRFFTAMQESDALSFGQIFNPRHRLVCLVVF